MTDYTKSEWNGFSRLDFKFMGRNAVVVVPEKKDIKGRWLLKTEYFGAFPDFEIEMLKRGWHLAYVANSTRWHKAEDDDVKAAFCDFVSENFGLNKKCLPVGMSCGGMHAVYFAAKYPSYVSALYLDAPVLNLLSCPLGMGDGGDDMAEEFFRDTGLTASYMLNYRNHPIDNVQRLIENRIPILLICGGADTTVPYCENGAVLAEKYRAANGDITEIIKPECGHHPHGLDDPAPIIEFSIAKTENI